MEANRYDTPAAFRQALEDRLNRMARDQAVDVQRLRRKVAFDRFLSRLFQFRGTLGAQGRVRHGVTVRRRPDYPGH